MTQSELEAFLCDYTAVYNFSLSLQLHLWYSLSLQGYTAQHTISKASRLVSSVRKSTINTEAILQATGKRLLAMNATRWNSQLKMLRRLDEVLQTDPNIQDRLSTTTKLTAHDIRILRELLQVLLPFEDATDVMQGENTTAGFVLPSVVGIRSRLAELEQKGNIYHLKPVLANLKSSLQRRFAGYEEDKLLQLAAVLDPRFKLKWCSGSTSEQIRDLLNAEAKAVAPPPSAKKQPTTPETTKPPSKKSRLFGTFTGDCDKEELTSDCEAEVSSYLAEPILRDLDSNPLEYWKKKPSSTTYSLYLGQKGVMCSSYIRSNRKSVFNYRSYCVSV